MKHNLFGDPVPGTLSEIVEAMEDRDLDPGEAHAAIYEASDPDPDGSDGWYAEIADATTGDGFFVTLNFASIEALRQVLRGAGIASVEVM